MGLWLKCPGCQAKNPLYLKVCGQCGKSLDNLPPEKRVYVVEESPLATPQAPPSAPPVEVAKTPVARPKPVPPAAPKAAKKSKPSKKKKN